MRPRTVTVSSDDLMSAGVSVGVSVAPAADTDSWARSALGARCCHGKRDLG